MDDNLYRIVRGNKLICIHVAEGDAIAANDDASVFSAEDWDALVLTYDSESALLVDLGVTEVMCNEN